MPLANIRAEYAAQLAAINGIGAVHDCPRFAADWATFLNLFKDPNKERILGWEISLESAPGDSFYIAGASPNAIADVRWSAVIRGYMAFNDGKDDPALRTQPIFDNLLEAILAKFRPLQDLNGKAMRCEPMVLAENIHGPLGGVECHYAELRQIVWERVTY